MSLSPDEREALRECALICWQSREALGLNGHQVDRVLLAWEKVGTDTEAEAAAEVRAARMAAERKQAEFSSLLTPPQA